MRDNRVRARNRRPSNCGETTNTSTEELTWPDFGVVGGKPGDPPSLGAGFDRSWPVVLPGPVKGVLGRVSGEDGHAGDDSAGTAGATPAGHFDPLPRAGKQVRMVDRSGGRLVITGSAEIGPVDPVRGPLGLPEKFAAS